MQIDWFTFACQVINFLILVWLLKRFLYGPILRSIDQREQAIAERLQSAADREAAAAAAQKKYEDQQAELTHLKESLLADAAAEVERWRKDRLQELREEIAEARRSWHESIAREQRQFLAELRERTARQVHEVVRHVLQELASCELEQQMVRQFLKHLHQESDRTWSEFRNGQQQGTAVVRTAFAVSPAGQTSLSDEISQCISAETVHFEVDPELICGIELIAGDHKLQWNVDNYLESLQRSITTALDQQSLSTRSQL